MHNPFYKKEYLPGYTGHVPMKNDLFGVTAGDANKILISPKGTDQFFSGEIVVKPSNSGQVKTQTAPNSSRRDSRYSSWRTSSAGPEKRMLGVTNRYSQASLKQGVQPHKLFNRTKSQTIEQRDFVDKKVNDKVKVGNNSKAAENWICGPEHMVQK